MNAVYRLCGAVFLVMALAVTPSAATADTSEAYWVWSLDRPLAALAEDADIYVLQGQIDDGPGGPGGPGGPRFRFQGVPAGPSLPGGGALTLVYRLDDLVPVPFLMRRFLVHRRAWRDAGRRVAGLQIDFDSPTGGLPAYGHWLAVLRAALGPETVLSITGLGDWLVSAPAADLRRLAAAPDFIAFMMYHGDRPLAATAPYLRALVQFPARFRLGLLAAQKDAPALDAARRARHYGGDIIFLLPAARS